MSMRVMRLLAALVLVAGVVACSDDSSGDGSESSSTESTENSESTEDGDESPEGDESTEADPGEDPSEEEGTEGDDPNCGDGTCDADEDGESCPADCGGGEGEIEICDNAEDDDGDGDADCDDPDCVADEACAAAPESMCEDGVDEDGDGDTDCDDEDCANNLACETCGNGNCAAVEDCNSCPDDCGECPPEICDNGADDDGDGLADCADLIDCADAENCDDGTPDVETACTDFNDNDNDGLTDCQDDDCADVFPCSGEEAEDTTGFPSNELGVKIISPSATNVGQSLGSVAPISGTLFGHADSLTWTHLGSGDSDNITIQPFWQSDGIKLEQGDNRIVVTAVNSETGEEATDTIDITYNPAFVWDTIPRANPEVVFTGSTTNVVIYARLGLVKNFDPNTIEVWATDENGEPTNKVGDLRDNGNTGTFCDEVDSDGLFSGCLSVNPPDAGLMNYRIRADVSNVFEDYVAWSPVFHVQAVDKFTAGTCNATLSVLQNAQTSYNNMAETMTAAEAQTATIEELVADPAVAEAGPASGDGWGIWVVFENGVAGALGLSPDGYRGGDLETNSQGADAPPLNIGAKNAALLAPFNAEFGDQDEVSTISDIMTAVGCPFFDQNNANNQNANLFAMRRLGDNGVIALSSHGEAMFETLSADKRSLYHWEATPSQEIIWTGEPVDCSKFVQSTPSCSGEGSPCSANNGECALGNPNKCVDYKHADVAAGRLVMTPTTWAITPGFIDFHGDRRPFPRSLVYLGGCRTMFNGGFASSFFGAGARAIAGFSDYVKTDFAYTEGVSFFTNMITNGLSAGESMANEEGDHQDPEAMGYFRLFGASNLSLADAAVNNPSFETGDRTAWAFAGDGRVVAGLGATIPVEGKFMGLVSTGLGFTQQTGELKQTFCIDSTQTTGRFYWKYYSEEFLEWCGSTFQDTFVAKLDGDVGQITMVNVTVDSLCPSSECGGCGGQYVGLVPSDVSFDVGGVYNTPWQLAESDVSALAGTGPVTFSYFTTDAGDSIYDTVILVDALEFE